MEEDEDLVREGDGFLDTDGRRVVTATLCGEGGGGRGGGGYGLSPEEGVIGGDSVDDRSLPCRQQHRAERHCQIQIGDASEANKED